MHNAVIVKAVRTPIGRRGGGLSAIHPIDLAAHTLVALQERTGLDPGVIDDVVWGCVGQIGEQSLNIGRKAVIAAGWPESVPGTTVDRQCGSSQQAIHFAAAGIAAGHYEVVVAGGSESMSVVPIGASVGERDALGPRYRERYNGTIPHQGRGAEAIARRWELSRRMLDEFAVESHRRAAAAQRAGLFDAEIAPVDVGGQTITRDEGIRPDSTLERLSQLKPVFDEEGVVTAASSSQVSDGAAALLMMSEQLADRLGFQALARVHSVAVAGDDPVIMLTAPIPATHKLLKRGGLRIQDIGAFEVNEAFASVPLAWQAEFGVPTEALNPLGGAIALGHPLGASGARIMTTMLHHMRRNGIQYGLQTMCEGGGVANATILEVL